MTNSTLWVDLRGDIRKVIAGGYDRSSLDKQLRLTRVKYDQLAEEGRVQKEAPPITLVDSTTMSADKATTLHAVAELTESRSSVPIDRSQASEAIVLGVKKTYSLKPWAGFDPRGVSPVPRNLPPLPVEKKPVKKVETEEWRVPIRTAHIPDDPKNVLSSILDIHAEQHNMNISDAEPIRYLKEGGEAEPEPVSVGKTRQEEILAEFEAELDEPTAATTTTTTSTDVEQRERGVRQDLMNRAEEDYDRAKEILKRYQEGPKRNRADEKNLEQDVKHYEEEFEDAKKSYSLTVVPFADSGKEELLRTRTRDKSPSRLKNPDEEKTMAEPIQYTSAKFTGGEHLELALPYRKTTIGVGSGRGKKKRPTKKKEFLLKQPVRRKKELPFGTFAGEHAYGRQSVAGWGAKTLRTQYRIGGMQGPGQDVNIMIQAAHGVAGVQQVGIADDTFETAQGYMATVAKAMRLTSNLPASLAPIISNNPVRPTMSRSFGSTISKPRRIAIPGGMITAVRGQTVIQCSRKSPKTVTQVTAFLQTNFPYGGKIGGVMYSLVALIPRVLKGLPGSVTINT